MRQAEGTTKLPATRYTRTIELSDSDGPLDLFEPLAARDMMVAVSNTGSADLELEFYEDGSSVPTYRTVPAGLSKSFTEAHVVYLFASCLGRGCKADVDVAFAPPSNDNPGSGIDSLKAWFVPPAVEGSADSAPDGSPGVCLRDPDVLWESEESYDAHVDVKVDGDHSATVEVYYNGGAAIASYDLQSKAEAPNNDVYVEEHEDVTEVRVRCEKSVLADCGKCQYDYEITFLK